VSIGIVETMSVDTAGLRVLTRAECLHLLRTVNVGRVAVSHRALPMILPVAFEADGPAGSTEPTWSVIVHGVAIQPQRLDRFAAPGGSASPSASTR
jgi:hypothetical protein